MQTITSLPAAHHRQHLIVFSLGFLVLCAAALGVSAGGLDDWIARAFFDSSAQTFPARAWFALELIGHKLAKDAVVVTAAILVGAALIAPRLPSLAPHCTLLRLTVLAMGAGPLAVGILKSHTAQHCPWDLTRFGGQMAEAAHSFVTSDNAGHCFPSAHAAGGFSFFAFYFAGLAMDNLRLQRAGMWVACVAGSMFSLVRIAQGAHFLSHNLWAAAIDWLCAGLVILPFTRLAVRDRVARRAPQW